MSLPVHAIKAAAFLPAAGVFVPDCRVVVGHFFRGFQVSHAKNFCRFATGKTTGNSIEFH